MTWAYPLEDFNENLFKSPQDFNILFSDFCAYCNITNLQFIQGVM